MRHSLVISTATLVAMLTFCGSMSAMGSPQERRSDVAAAAPNGVTAGDGYVIVNPAAAVTKGQATFYATGPISSDTLVVIPDRTGALPGGLSRANLAKAVAQMRSTGKLPPSLGGSPQLKAFPAASQFYAWAASSAGFSRNFQGGSIWGMSWSTKALYGFNTAPGFNQAVTGLGKGHYQGYNGSLFGVWTTYYSLGIADDSGSAVFVPWGYVADNEGFEGKCVISTVCFGNFWNF